jgi:hypothetical protein
MASDPRDASRLGTVALQGAVAVAAIVVVMVLGRGRTFFFDEWDWVQHRSDGGLETLMRPHNGHLMPLPVALYRLQFEVVGFSAAWPVRLVTIAAHVAAAGVLYRLARVRVGGAGAAAVALVFVSLGAAWQTLLWGIQLSVTISVLGGLVAWLALDRGTRTADATACVALLVSAASFSVGPVFAAAVAVELAASRRLRSTWWVPAVPLGLFTAAYVAYGDSTLTADGLRGAAGWALDAASAATGGIAVLGPNWGLVVLAMLAVAIAVVVLRGRFTARLAGLLVAGALFWTLTGASRSSGVHADSPLASRYIEIGAPIVLLVIVEVCRGRTLAGWWRVPVAALVAFCVWRGVSELVEQGALLRRNSDTVLAGVAAMEIARPHVDPNLIPVPDAAPQLRAEDYFRAAETVQRPVVGDPVARLGGLPEEARLVGDALLAGIELRETPAPVDPAGCREVRGADLVQLPPGAQVRIEASSEPVSLHVRRFADDFPSKASMSVAPGGATLIEVLADDARRPWRLRVSSSAPFRICQSSEQPPAERQDTTG